MKRRSILPFVVLAVVLTNPGPAAAQNSTYTTATYLTHGQVFNLVVDDSTPQRWYNVVVQPGRSYCAEVWTDAVYNYQQSDPWVWVYRSDGTTLLVENDDTNTEPDSTWQSRACFVAPAGLFEAYLKVTLGAGATGAHRFQGRLVETTLFCPWYFIAGDYDSFVLLRNTTSQAVSVTVNWRHPVTGSLAAGNGKPGTLTVTVPGNGTAFLSSRNYVSAATTTYGSIEVAYNGSPGAITGSTTTLSGTTGLGFDALFTERKYR